MQACNPKSNNFLTSECLDPLVEMYNLDKNSIQIECVLAKRVLATKELKDVADALVALHPLRDAFPNIINLLHIALTISVTTAQCERSFSSLKRINHVYVLPCLNRDLKTWLFCQLSVEFLGVVVR